MVESFRALVHSGSVGSRARFPISRQYVITWNDGVTERYVTLCTYRIVERDVYGRARNTGHYVLVDVPVAVFSREG